jgi:hypothetical protein
MKLAVASIAFIVLFSAALGRTATDRLDSIVILSAYLVLAGLSRLSKKECAASHRRQSQRTTR